jgi:hypothetical protein
VISTTAYQIFTLIAVFILTTGSMLRDGINFTMFYGKPWYGKSILDRLGVDTFFPNVTSAKRSEKHRPRRTGRFSVSIPNQIRQDLG